jgi:phosphoglucomutase
LTNIPRLVSDYYVLEPDPSDEAQRVAFGTSGHRGSSLRASFNESHVRAIIQAVCQYRRSRGVDGPLFLGMDTHALSEPALVTALEVLVGNEVAVSVQPDRRYTPTPLVSHAILTHNRRRSSGLADGVVITPSHNPPEDGGIKYNPPEGGPASASATRAIQDSANAMLEAGLGGIRMVPFARAIRSGFIKDFDFIGPYVKDLADVLDMEAVAGSGLRIGVDPLGGATIDVWEPLAEHFGLDLEVVNRRVDPAFAFMPLDRDGKIRMDCSSPYAMAGLIRLKQRFDIAFGNDPDGDRHGIVTPGGGLMNPNHVLAAGVWHLFRNRTGWPAGAAVGKTLVSSAMIDRVAAHLGRSVFEVPVGFKWFVGGLLDGSLAFAGEESAGAAFVRRNGSVWTTDKDGIMMGLLACEITAREGRDPAALYAQLEERFGRPAYRRLDVAATSGQRDLLKRLTPDDVPTRQLAGESIREILTRAPGNDQPIGGLKLAIESGWAAVRPSGTEDIAKIYAESFKGEAHLDLILEEAQAMVSAAFKAAGV